MLLHESDGSHLICLSPVWSLFLQNVELSYTALTCCRAEASLFLWWNERFTFNLTGNRSSLCTVTANICSSQRLDTLFPCKHSCNESFDVWSVAKDWKTSLVGVCYLQKIIWNGKRSQCLPCFCFWDLPYSSEAWKWVRWPGIVHVA